MAACRPHGCDTEPEPACDMLRPECLDDEVAVVRDGCWRCVLRATCDPREPTECELVGGYCEHFLTPCRDGFVGGQPMGCPLGRSGMCCLPEGGDCVEEGGSIPVVPDAPECCPGLEAVGCARPVEGVCEPCVGAVVCVRCGDGQCGEGENVCNCPDDCPAEPPMGPCDDGGPVFCEIEPRACEPGSILAARNGCWACVNPATCLPWGEAECRDDSDCPDGETCDECGSSSCPACDDCVPACAPRELRWYLTCGDPVCRGHIPEDGLRLCDEEAAGQACGEADDRCDPVDGCNARLVCTDTDPRQGPCPISKREVKREIRYVDAAERARLAASLEDIRLATYRYVNGKARRLGFIIDDHPPPEALRGEDQVELYGYLSLAVAAIQEERAVIDRL